MERPSRSAHIYRAVKAEIRSGAYLPGHPICAATLSKRFSTSIIPVREALNRLTGERLVEARDHTGFFVPLVNEVWLRDLYNAHYFLVLCELERRAAPHVELRDIFDADAAPSAMGALDRLFTLLADTSGSREVRNWLRNTIDRLHPVYLRKPEVADDWEDECARLLDHWQHAGLDAFKNGWEAYHRRRLALVPELVERLSQPSTTH